MHDALFVFAYFATLALFFLGGFVAGAASVQKTIRHAVDRVADLAKGVLKL